MSEVWKDIEGYEGLYQISNCGRVKSLNYSHTNKERILKPGKNTKGYLYVNLWKNGKGKNHYIHRLVSSAFLKNTYSLPCVNHKDEDKTNNSVENLEFCSYQYNNNYGTRNQQITEKQSKTVYQYTLDGEFIKEWKSASEVERQMGYSHHISECCLGKRKSSYGYIWRYRQ